jgi:hypothetical protein
MALQYSSYVGAFLVSFLSTSGLVLYVWIILFWELLPCIANLLSVNRCNPLTDLDITPMPFTARGILRTLGAIRFRPLNHVSITQEHAFTFSKKKRLRRW